ncbi:MAG TPA: phosphoribosylanthranilate isomerase [Syntrophales bacterium]|nr:phosphoribosylanthranilate isomerase [Syntrophales bacterium]
MDGIIQIAGVVDEREAMMLVEAGIVQIGFPIGVPVHKEDIGAEHAARIIRLLKSPAVAVLITYLDRAEEIIDLRKITGAQKVQLHGRISISEVVNLKKLAPDLPVIKSLIVGADNPEEIESTLLEFSSHVDAFMTDTYDPVTGACGATGKTHDWDVSRRLVSISPRPVILAGGLTPENVGRAIRRVRPAGVDAHTGVEEPDGRKDERLVRAFVREAREAFASL